MRAAGRPAALAAPGTARSAKPAKAAKAVDPDYERRRRGVARPPALTHRPPAGRNGRGRHPSAPGRPGGQASRSRGRNLIPPPIRRIVPHAGFRRGTRLMTVELGHLALILAFLVAVLQMVVPMVGAHRGWSDWMRVAVPAATVQFALTLAAFLRAHACLRCLRLLRSPRCAQLPLRQADDLQARRHLGEPRGLDAALDADPHLLRRHGGLVGRQPAPRAAAPACWRPGHRCASPSSASSCLPPIPSCGLQTRPLTATTSTRSCRTPASPSTRRSSTSATSASRWPISFAVAALIEGRVDAGLGALGAALDAAGLGFPDHRHRAWAPGRSYYELGWGGWWFWDPVENASFMPWLIAAALLHSAIVVEKRDTLKSWTILLAILAFSLLADRRPSSCARGSSPASTPSPTTPSAASSPAGSSRAFIGGSLTLYAWRAPVAAARTASSPPSAARAALVVNNLLLVVATLVVFFGTIWPLLAEVLTGRKISVGPALLRPRLHALHGGAGGDPAGRRDAALEARQPAAGRWQLRGRWRWRWRSARWSGRCRPGGRCWRRSARRSRRGWSLGAFADMAERVRLGRVGPGETARRRAQPAAGRLGQGRGARRARRHHLRHRRDHRLGSRRTSASSGPARASAFAGYDVAARRRGSGRGPNYAPTRATLTVLRGRRGGRHAAAREAVLPGAAHAHDRGRHRPGLHPRPLRRAGRPAGGRRLGGADLRQALRQLDLDRRARHGGWAARSA